MTVESLLNQLQPYQGNIINLALALAIFLVGWSIAKWVNQLILKVLRKRKLDESLARFLASLAQYGVLAATVITSLDHAGVPTTSFLAVLGSAGLAVGLALQGSLGHFASGVMLLIFRPFALTDVIETAGQTGTVTDVGLFSTTLVNLDNHRITIPNGAITSGTIVNFTALGHRRAQVSVGVSYGSDLTRVREILIRAIESCPTIRQDPAPAVVLAGLGASSVDFSVFVWCDVADYGKTLDSTRQAVYQALNDAHIEIPFNQLVIHQAGEA